MNLFLHPKIFSRSKIRGHALLPLVILLLPLLIIAGQVKATNMPTAAAVADITVKGTVVDTKGVGIPGATVKVKSSGKSVATNANGDFSITVPSVNDVLVISFIGYKTLEVPVNNRNTIKITLAEEASNLEEVVVVGFGIQKKRDLTGAVSVVKAEDIVARPGPDPVESLQGRVAG